MAEATRTLTPVPLTSERFAPYGEVIDAAPGRPAAMNEARFERFDDLCEIDVGDDARVALSVARCRTPTTLPLRVDKLERHPRGSQAFIPLQPCRMVLVVAPPGESFDVTDLRAFVTTPRQGFNYRRGTWHMPLIGFKPGDEFLVVDRGGDAANCEERMLDEVVMLEAV